MQQDNARSLGHFETGRSIAGGDRRSVPAPVVLRPGGDGLAPLGVPRVVLVDDDERLRAVVREVLEDEGITVADEAGSAGAALDLLGTAAGALPMVALVDVRMPGLLNGIELTRVLAWVAPSVRVVVFTGFLELSIEQAARDAGAATVLHKGAPVSELAAAIRRAWAGVPVGR